MLNGENFRILHFLLASHFRKDNLWQFRRWIHRQGYIKPGRFALIIKKKKNRIINL